MAERLGLVSRSTRDDLRERVVRVLRGVGPEAQRASNSPTASIQSGDLRARPSLARRRSGSQAGSSTCQSAASGAKNWFRRVSSRWSSRASRGSAPRRASPRSPAPHGAVARAASRTARAPAARAAPRAAPGRASAGRRRPGPCGRAARRHEANDQVDHGDDQQRAQAESSKNSQPISAAVAEEARTAATSGECPAVEGPRRRTPGRQGSRDRSPPGPRRPAARGPRAGPAGAAARRPPRAARRSSPASAGASSHEASTASPARVRAVQSRSNIEPRPKRSRSAA